MCTKILIDFLMAERIQNLAPLTLVFISLIQKIKLPRHWFWHLVKASKKNFPKNCFFPNFFPPNPIFQHLKKNFLDFFFEFFLFLFSLGKKISKKNFFQKQFKVVKYWVWGKKKKKAKCFCGKKFWHWCQYSLFCFGNQRRLSSI